MRQSSIVERRGAQCFYESGEMNIAEIARNAGRSEKTIHQWKKAEGWVHPDNQPVVGVQGFGPWPEVLEVSDAGVPEHRIGRAQHAALTSENPMDGSGPTEEASHPSTPELDARRAETEALRAKRDALIAKRDALLASNDALRAELGKYKPA